MWSEFVLIFIFISEIKGYIRMCFKVATSRNGQMTYGSGAIAMRGKTGIGKVPVEISNYVPTKIDKGTCVIVTGTLVESSK